MNLNQITVSSTDVAASARFYRRLGLILIVDSLPDYVRFEMPEGEATFSIHRHHQLCLFHAGEARRHPPWRVQADV